MSQNEDNAASPDKKVAPRYADTRTPMASSTPTLAQPRIEPTRNNSSNEASRVSFRQDSSSASARSKLLFGDSSGSILAPATRFATETDNSQLTTGKGGSKPGAESSSTSLFCSVMKNAQQHSTPAKPARSLSDFLEGLDSPFSPTPQTPKSTGISTTGTPATLGTPLNDWIEYDVGETIDWSVYDRVELQAQPTILHNHEANDTAALADFCASANVTTWGTIHYYWEHPAVPMAAELRKEKQASTKRKRSFREMVREQEGFTLHRQQQQPNENDELSMNPWLLRKRQWQEALRSLYFKFKAVAAANEEADEDEDDAEDRSNEDLYFLSTIPDDHTILFRWKDRQPQVTINKCGVQFREQLRERGATLWLRDTEFTESMLLDSNSAWNAVSPSTKAELVELRRAQARGETLGADIAVQSAMGKRRVPVLTVRGLDDCDALLEVYMNRYGQTMGTMQDTATTAGATIMTSTDVPKLLCRHLGPFLHSALHKLRPSGKGWMGSVLPCAVRELQGLASEALLAAAGEENQQTEDDSTTAAAPHHWLLRAESETRNLMVAWDMKRPESLACKVSNF